MIEKILRRLRWLRRRNPPVVMLHERLAAYSTRSVRTIEAAPGADHDDIGVRLYAVR